MVGAAFYDFDGTLIRTNLVHALWYFSRNESGLLQSLKRSAATLASVPLFAATNFYDRQVFNELFFRWYKGEKEDRLRYLSEELFEDILKPSIFEGVTDLIASSRKAGLAQVIVTGAPDFTIRPIAKHLGMDVWVSNRLEFVGGAATGKLVPPIMAAATKATWIRNFCEENAMKLSDCFAYADSISDLPMLSMVGHPTAVNPDFRLKQTARRHDWPVLHLEEAR